MYRSILDQEALAFYQRFVVFQSFTDNPMRIFVLMSVLRKI